MNKDKERKKEKKKNMKTKSFKTTVILTLVHYILALGASIKICVIIVQVEVYAANNSSMVFSKEEGLVKEEYLS